MRDALSKYVNFLRDPYLVRRIQEAFGVKEIQTNTRSGAPGTNVRWYRIKRQLQNPGNNTQPSGIECECNAFVDVYFRFAKELGYEPFYITVFPALFWNVDTYLGRHIVILWCASMYIGQALKALVKWKRPSSPPAIRLEQNSNLETEFGFPSTHAVVSTTVPFYWLYNCFERYEFPLAFGLVLALTWCWSVCISRIYLGVHSVMDIIGGLLIASLVLVIATPCTSLVDDFIFNAPPTMTVTIGITVVVLVLYIYPTDPHHWSTDRGDTAAILGVGLGVYLGSIAQGPTPDDLLSGPMKIVVPSHTVIGLGMVRFVVGILLLLPTRFVMKLLCFRLLPAIMPTHGVEDVVKRPLVELPYKILTYGSIGFSAVYLSQIVFTLCNISRFNLIDL